MTFGFNAFWRSNLAFDLGIVATSLLFSIRLIAVVQAKGESRGWKLVLVALVGGGLGLLPWVCLGLLDGSIWGFCLIARSLWTGATVAAPLLATIEVVRSRRYAWLIFVLSAIAFKWWGEVYEPANVEVLRVTIPVAGLKTPVRIAHLSDLQTDGIRPADISVRATVDEFVPDFVVFTGDVLNHPSLIPSVFDYLRGFKATRAKLFVSGDVDTAFERETFAAGTGFEVLDGAVKHVRVGATDIAFLGFGLQDYQRGPTFARELNSRAGAADVRIALSHRPDAVFALQDIPVALLFSGHTHGGQVVIPGFGPPVTLTRVPRVVAAGGVHEFLGIRIVLSRGLGREGHIAPRVRLFCRPQLILAELVPGGN